VNALEDYLLICLAEEAAEVSHAVAKALRFGLDTQWETRGKTNREAIEEELGDLKRLADRLGLEMVRPDKGDKFDRMMEKSRKLGRLLPSEPSG
jgi:NTP pyrophosphatase (non-canonical NTP hydrolase)